MKHEHDTEHIHTNKKIGEKKLIEPNHITCEIFVVVGYYLSMRSSNFKVYPNFDLTTTTSINVPYDLLKRDISIILTFRMLQNLIVHSKNGEYVAV